MKDLPPSCSESSAESCLEHCHLARELESDLPSRAFRTHINTYTKVVTGRTIENLDCSASNRERNMTNPVLSMVDLGFEPAVLPPRRVRLSPVHCRHTKIIWTT